MTKTWGKIEYYHSGEFYRCKLFNGNNLDLLSLASGIAILLTWTVSLFVFISIRVKTKKNLEDTKIYIRRVEIADASATEHIRYHKNEVEIEKSSYQLLKYLIICYTVIRLPRKNSPILATYLHIIWLILLSDMVSTITTTLSLSYGPYFKWINVASYILVYCTVITTPIVYVCSNKFFKRAFYDTFSFCKSKDKEEIQLNNLDKEDSSDIYTY